MFKQMIAVQPIPESEAQLRVLLRERLLANIGEKTKGKLEKLMARCHQSGGLATVDELYECAATSEAIKKDWVKGRGSKVSVAKSYMPDVDEASDEEESQHKMVGSCQTVSGSCRTLTDNFQLEGWKLSDSKLKLSDTV